MVAIDVGEQDRELVAPEAGHGAVRTDGRGDPPGDEGQQPVALLVAERVVDLLEAI